MPPSCEEDLSNANSVVRKRLELFETTPSVHIRYFPPPREENGTAITAAPGIGIIIFNDDLALFGFAPEEAQSPVTRGFIVRGSKAVKPVIRWFDSQVFQEFGSRVLIRNSSAKAGECKYRSYMEQLIQQYYESRTAIST